MSIRRMALLEIRTNCEKAEELIYAIGRKIPAVQEEMCRHNTDVGELMSLIRKNKEWARELINMPAAK